MNPISKFFILIFLGFIASCAHVYDVNYDFSMTRRANYDYVLFCSVLIHDLFILQFVKQFPMVFVLKANEAVEKPASESRILLSCF